MYFDVDEEWSCGPNAGAIDLGIVVLHEIGHAIGLRHENSDPAVMEAYYNPALTFGPLADDIIGAGEIYGGGLSKRFFFGNVGIGTDSPDSHLNIQRGGDLGVPSVDTVLHLENEREGGYGTDLSITSTAKKSSRIHFSRNGDMDAGGLYYSHRTDNMTFISKGATRMQLGPGVGSLPEVEFFGDVSITGSLSKGGGGFKIDHPLEPDKKYLHHSFVESPDMKNVYDGNVELDDKGEVWIQMPDYFEALNREFRYQLTPIGAPAPSLFVAEMISDNRFKIAGGPAGLLVSWQVTGVRKDTWAQANRIQVEESKNRN